MAKRNKQGSQDGHGERTCIFCGGRPVTKEHVLPMWIAELLRDGSGTFVGTMESVSNGAEQPPRRLRSRADILSPVRIVCAACNGGWMSDLESAAKPIIKPMVLGEVRVFLTAEEQAIIARWAVKTALLMGYLENPPHPAPAARLAWIREEIGAPPASWVYLAMMAPGGPTLRGRFHFSERTDMTGTIVGGRFRVATLLLRRLVIQVLQMDLAAAVTGEPDTTPEHWERAFQIWPYSPLLRSWPPNVALSEMAFTGFADNFTNLNLIRTPD